MPDPIVSTRSSDSIRPSSTRSSGSDSSADVERVGESQECKQSSNSVGSGDGATLSYPLEVNMEAVKRREFKARHINMMSFGITSNLVLRC
jgi:hypothetical protein